MDELRKLDPNALSLRELLTDLIYVGRLARVLAAEYVNRRNYREAMKIYETTRALLETLGTGSKNMEVKNLMGSAALGVAKAVETLYRFCERKYEISRN